MTAAGISSWLEILSVVAFFVCLFLTFLKFFYFSEDGEGTDVYRSEGNNNRMVGIIKSQILNGLEEMVKASHSLSYAQSCLICMCFGCISVSKYLNFYLG